MADWVIKTNSKKDVKLRLFCFPYAGSSALVTYKFLADNIINLNSINPQVAARIMEPFTRVRRYDVKRQELMLLQIKRIQSVNNLCNDLTEIIDKILCSKSP